LYGDALTRVEARKPLVGPNEPPSPYTAIVNFWITDAQAFAAASAAHGATLVQDKAQFTNSEQKVQSEVVFAETGKPASAMRAGDRCLTVLYPRDAEFDYDDYRDRHVASLLELFGRDAISRIEARRGLPSADGRNAPAYSCTANVYIENAETFAAAAARNQQRVVDDVRRFTSATPVTIQTEVLGAFDS
jgi:uncharacterized protein (TIGR02118 family)